MIYKYNPAVKEKYCKKLVLYYVIRYLYILGVVAVINILLKALYGNEYGFNIHIIECLGICFLVVFGLAYRKSIKLYDEQEVELTDTFLEVRYFGHKVNIPFNELTSVSAFPSFVDRKRIKITGKKMVAVAISSYLEGFDEVKAKLVSIKPEVKGLFIKHKLFLHGILFADYILMLFGLMFNKTALYVSFILAILYFVFRILVTINSAVTKKQKVTLSVINSFGIVLYLVLFFTWSNNLKGYAFRKAPGKTIHVDVWQVNEINKYDKNGNLVYLFDGESEYKYKYDSEGREIYSKDLTDKYESWTEYDDATGKVCHEWDSEGFESWKEYNEEGKAVHYKTNENYEWWKSYDKDTRTENYKNTNNTVWYNEYDEAGNVIHYKRLQDDECKDETWSEYDEKGNLIHERYLSGEQLWRQYDESGNCVYERWLNGNETFYYYDENGNEIYRTSFYQDPDADTKKLVSEERYEYNSHNDIVKWYDSTSDFVFLYDYDYDKNGNVLKEYFRRQEISE